MLNWRIVTLSLGSFMSVMFVSCVAYGLVAPARLHPAWLLETVLPGFVWLGFGSFALGLVETFLYGAYAGVVYSALYNGFTRLMDARPEVRLRPSRAA